MKHEVAGMFSRFVKCRRPVIRFTLAQVAWTGDLVILDAEVRAHSQRMKVWFDVIKIQVETDIAIKLAVDRIAGVAFYRTPNLFR